MQIKCDRCDAVTPSVPATPTGWAEMTFVDHNNRKERWDLCGLCTGVVRRCADTAAQPAIYENVGA